jgi:hypothetical protein
VASVPLFGVGTASPSVAGTAFEGAALASVLSVGVGSFSYWGGRDDR